MSMSRQILDCPIKSIIHKNITITKSPQ
jgi:hypothetical protein